MTERFSYVNLYIKELKIQDLMQMYIVYDGNGENFLPSARLHRDINIKY